MKSDTISELAQALTNFQGKMTTVKKDGVNPFFKSKYATLDTIWETIRKPLSENGLSLVQTMNLLEGKSVLETTLYHTSGQWISGTQLVNPVKDDPQSLGSAISYARRYSLSALLGIVSDDDDDANVATKPETKPAPKTEPITQGKIDHDVKIITTPTKESITPAQTRKIYASVKEKGVTVDRVKAYLKDVFHKLSTKELTISEASRLIEDINAGKLESALIKELKEAGAVEVEE